MIFICLLLDLSLFFCKFADILTNNKDLLVFKTQIYAS